LPKLVLPIGHQTPERGQPVHRFSFPAGGIAWEAIPHTNFNDEFNYEEAAVIPGLIDRWVLEAGFSTTERAPQT
jgi:hypothetical protein